MLQSIEDWREWLDSSPSSLEDIYGSKCLQGRIRLIKKCLDVFETNFNDCSNISVFRAPSRINLRGMHIDKHGGNCNGIAINRETVVVGRKEKNSKIVQIHNPPRKSFCFDISKISETSVPTKGWEKYIIACFKVLYELFEHEIENWNGYSAAVVSDIPQGSGLSSSHSFIIAILCFTLKMNSKESILCEKLKLMRLSQKVEYVLGAATGLSDQGTILFAKSSEVLNARFYEKDSNEDIRKSLKYIPFPEELSIVVVDSGTNHCLHEGVCRLKYALPRIANSIGFHMLKEKLPTLKTISDIISLPCTEVVSLLQQIPEIMSLKTIKSQYPLLCKELLNSYNLSDLDKETNIHIRGPLLYCISECARALQFPEQLRLISDIGDDDDKEEYIKELGEFLNIGHKGDSNHSQKIRISNDIPIWKIPGDFKASTPELDQIQSQLMSLDAYGACLTGAGYGGCVIGLFVNTINVSEISKTLAREYFTKNKISDPSKRVFTVFPISGASFITFK